MKVLIFLKGYFPALSYGGPPVSIKNFSDLMYKDLDLYLITKNHDKDSNIPFIELTDKKWMTKENLKVKYLPDKDMSYRGLKASIEELSPDLIYLNSIFQLKVTLSICLIGNRKKIPILLAPRGELNSNALKMKGLKKSIYLKTFKNLLTNKFVYFQATSYQEKLAIKDVLNVSNRRILDLPNIPSLPTEKNVREINLKKEGILKIVFLSRIHPKKNIHFILEALKHVRGLIEFDIYGYIDDKSYHNKVLKEAHNLPKNISIRFMGQLQREQLFKTLSKYHLFVLPTLSENYGQAIVEAMLSGCPILISDQTPWSDINYHGGGWAISLENVHNYSKIIQKMINMNQGEFNQTSNLVKKYISEKLDMKNLYDSYKRALKKIVTKI